MYSTTHVNFHGQPLVIAIVDDECFVAMKPIVEGMGLNWRSQQAKLRASQRYGVIAIPLETKGGIQEMLCIPLEKLNGWLFSINPEKVRPDIKPKVELYQEECFVVLYNYWQHGEAINPRFHREDSTFPLAVDLKERLALIETKRKLALTITKVSAELHPILNKSLYEVCVRLGEVTPNSHVDEPLYWKEIIRLPDGSIPF
jgi:hypothetical protein